MFGVASTAHDQSNRRSPLAGKSRPALLRSASKQTRPSVKKGREGIRSLRWSWSEPKQPRGKRRTESVGSAQCGNRPCNFHYVWDIALLEHTGRSEQDYVAYLEQQIATNRWKASGTPEDWANESLKLAKQVWLPEGGSVDEAYYKANIGVVDQQLALAGLRLAALLNDVFTT